MIVEVRRQINYSGLFLAKMLEIPLAPFPGLVVDEPGRGRFVIRDVVAFVGTGVVVYTDRVSLSEAEDMLEKGGWSKS